MVWQAHCTFSTFLREIVVRLPFASAACTRFRAKILPKWMHIIFVMGGCLVIIKIDERQLSPGYGDYLRGVGIWSRTVHFYLCSERFEFIRRAVAGERCSRRILDIFGEPAWDILLDLFIAHERRQPICLSDASLGAGVPLSTAQRWVKQLLDRGLLVRHSDGRDHRRVLVSLSEHAVKLMRSYLEKHDGG